MGGRLALGSATTRTVWLDPRLVTLGAEIDTTTRSPITLANKVGVPVIG